MSSQFDEQFASLYWPNALVAFGTTVTYWPATAAGSTEITGVLSWRTDSEASIPGRWPSFEALLADFPEAPAKGDQLEIDSEMYTAFAVHSGQDGSVRIEFNKIA